MNSSEPSNRITMNLIIKTSSFCMYMSSVEAKRRAPGGRSKMMMRDRGLTAQRRDLRTAAQAASETLAA